MSEPNDASTVLCDLRRLDAADDRRMISLEAKAQRDPFTPGPRTVGFSLAP
jgi:hypothetical protein